MSEQNAQQNAPGPVPPHNSAARSPQHVYCGLSRHKLFELLEKYIENPRMYERVFFNMKQERGDFEGFGEMHGTPPKDPFHRCIECGRTIDEHPTAEQQQRLQAEYERRRNLGEIPD